MRNCWIVHAAVGCSASRTARTFNKLMRRIYADHNATTPLHPGVFEAMLPYLRDHFGNASSVHVFGREARAAIDDARVRMAKLLGAQESEIVFTGGGSV